MGRLAPPHGTEGLHGETSTRPGSGVMGHSVLSGSWPETTASISQVLGAPSPLQCLPELQNRHGCLSFLKSLSGSYCLTHPDPLSLKSGSTEPSCPPLLVSVPLHYCPLGLDPSSPALVNSSVSSLFCAVFPELQHPDPNSAMVYQCLAAWRCGPQTQHPWKARP